MSKKAWRIYHTDAIAKTELTQSLERVRQAREKGYEVFELIEVEYIPDDERNSLLLALAETRDIIGWDDVDGELKDLLVEACSLPESVPKLMKAYIEHLKGKK